jgi:predicted MPP superfamily phosphohydrolase
MRNFLNRLARTAAKAAGLGVGDIEVRSVPLRLAHWPGALTGLRVAVIADLHTGSPQIDEERLDKIVARVSAERVDLVALLGDYIDPAVALGEWIEPEAIAVRLGRLQSRLGSYAVLGNHDWAEAGPRMPAALRDAGITVLENDVVRADGFWIAGLGDYMTRSADLEGTLAKVPEREPVLLLSHNPDVFPQVPERVALTVSGHTHGAQVDLPFLRDRVTPSRFGARYTGGHVEEGGRHLYASDGIGTSRLPIRFRAKPEIAVLELSPSSAEPVQHLVDGESV